MARKRWQGLSGWWRAASSDTAADDRAKESTDRVRDASAETSSYSVTQSADAENVSESPSTRSRKPEPRDFDSTDPELLEFLAADIEPAAADPEFKRKLRDQLWTLIQSNQMPRQ